MPSEIGSIYFSEYFDHLGSECYKNFGEENQCNTQNVQTNLQAATGSASLQRWCGVKRKCETKQQKKDLSAVYFSFFVKCVDFSTEQKCVLVHCQVCFRLSFFLFCV